MITIIVAFDEEYSIGKNNSIPWHFSEDLSNFKKLTTDNVCIMGRNTWESLPNKFRPLPNRMNIIVSRSYYDDLDKFMHTLNKPPENPFDAFAVFSLEDALGFCSQNVFGKKIFIIGGAQIYKECLEKNYIHKMIVTKVKGKHNGDIKFPKIDWSAWRSRTTLQNANFEILEYEKI